MGEIDTTVVVDVPGGDITTLVSISAL